MHCGHIKVLLNPNFKFAISTSVKPHQQQQQQQPMASTQQSPEVPIEDDEDLIGQAEASTQIGQAEASTQTDEDLIGQAVDLQIQEIVEDCLHVQEYEHWQSFCLLFDATMEVKKQKDKAIKQAEKWKTNAQQQMSSSSSKKVDKKMHAKKS